MPGWPITLGESRLDESDASLLRPREWLNDSIICYCLERFRRDIHSNSPVMYLEPAITYTAAVLRSPAMLREMLSVERVKGSPAMIDELLHQQIVLMPINDKEDPDAHIGGGHWSLLCHRRSAAGAIFEHYDSCSGANRAVALAVAESMGPLLQNRPGVQSRFVEIEGVPQQCNGYDCGVYVLAFAEALTMQAFSGNQCNDDPLPPLGEICPLVEAISAAKVASLRAELYERVMQAATHESI